MLLLFSHFKLVLTVDQQTNRVPLQPSQAHVHRIKLLYALLLDYSLNINHPSIRNSNCQSKLIVECFGPLKRAKKGLSSLWQLANMNCHVNNM